MEIEKKVSQLKQDLFQLASQDDDDIHGVTVSSIKVSSKSAIRRLVACENWDQFEKRQL